jgi:DNA polymerase-3 subunit gamma/tau
MMPSPSMTEPYVVLARKWRPMSFEDLVGQEHVSQTLANSIAIGRVAHAFLFTGVRGVGKTTSARILAKALNCEKGPTATPCLVCPPCREIAAGNDMDVQEMDAATRTGVDDIRQLQESLPYRPARDRFKILIVDEVHMLSGSAWNAFLKTLEEPPPHVKFIFATTEVAKIPVTILSRCQRYDFKLIGVSTIAARLRYVLEKEGIAADDGAVQLLAREAAGSMRDAMSLLDQVIASAGAEAKLTSAGVAKTLGVAESAVLYRIAESAVGADAAGCLTLVGELAQAGYEMGHVARDLLALLRDLVVIRVAPEARGLLDVPDVEIEDLRRIAAKASPDDLTRMHVAFSKATEEILQSPSTRASLEMALVRLARRPPLVPIDDLLRRLGELESRLGSGGGGGGGGMARPASAREAQPRARPLEDGADDPEPARAQPAPVPQPAFRAPEPPAFRAPEPPAFRAPEPPAFRAPEPPPPSAPPPPEPRAPSVPPPPEPAHETPSHESPIRSSDDPRFERFASFVAVVREKSPRLAPLLERAALCDLNERGIVVALDPKSFEATFLGEAGARELLGVTTRAELGPAAEFRIVDLGRSKEPPATLARTYEEAARVRRAEADEAVRTHPLIAAAERFLGAQLKDVRIPEGGGSS